MVIGNIANGETGSSVRGKLNESIDLVNNGTYPKEQIAQGFIQREQTRGDLDVDLAVAIELNLLGAPVAGGYFAGLIDTLTGNIIAADDYQTGLRYALIVSPKDLEGGRGASPASGLPTGDLEWDTQDRSGEAGCFTRWNGLEATNVIIAKSDASYEAHGFIADVRSQYPAVATPGGSEWYLPAMDELELLYRNFKPNNADNNTKTAHASPMLRFLICSRKATRKRLILIATGQRPTPTREAELGTSSSLLLGLRASSLPVLRTKRSPACVPSGAWFFRNLKNWFTKRSLVL